MHQNTIDKLNALIASSGSPIRIEEIVEENHLTTVCTNKGFLTCVDRCDHDSILALFSKVGLNGLTEQASVIIATDRANKIVKSIINADAPVRVNEFRIRQRYRRIQRCLIVAIITLAILAAAISIHAYFLP